MTYRECVFFIGRCLTLDDNPGNKDWVANHLVSKKVDWDYVLKISSDQAVHLALFSNLKRAGLLDHLPAELVEFLSLMASLNKERNLQIMDQVKTIGSLLKRNSIIAVFLKGIGFLFEGLYRDNSERIISDIDFLVSPDDFEKAITVLKKDGYSEVKPQEIDRTFLSRHYAPMSKEGQILSIEIHHAMVSGKCARAFNYESIKGQINEISEGVFTLCQDHQIAMTCFNKQVNDHGRWNKKYFLRSGYDLFLLSQRTSTLKAIENFRGRDFNILNNFLSSTRQVFGNASTIEHKKNYSSDLFLGVQNYLSKHHNIRTLYLRFWDKAFKHQRTLKKIAEVMKNRHYRLYLTKKYINPHSEGKTQESEINSQH